MDTSEPLSELLRVTERLPVLAWERDDMVHFVLGLIAYKEKAMLEMGYGCLELVQQAMGTDLSEDMVSATNAVSSFAQSLYHQLCVLQAYQSGYLF